MKKFGLLCSALALLLALAACDAGGDRQNGNTQLLQPPTQTTQQPTQSTAVETTQATTVPTEDATAPTEAQRVPDAEYYARYSALYTAELQDFVRLIEFRFLDEYGLREDLPLTSQAMQNGFLDSEIGYRFSSMYAELPMYGGTHTLADYGYILHDLNDDAVPELFWVRQDDSILAVFTCRDGKVVPLDSYWSRYYAVVTEENILCTWGSSSAADARCSNFILTADGYLYDAYGTYSQSSFADVNFYAYTGTDTEQITQERFDELCALYTRKQSALWKDLPIHPLQELPVETLRVQIPRGDFLIREEASYDAPAVGTVQQAGTYTVVETVSDREGNQWGKLKSGAGWIDLTLLEKEKNDPPLLTVSYGEEGTAAAHTYRCEPSEYAVTVQLLVHENVTEVALLAGAYDPELDLEVLQTIDRWGKDQGFLATLTFPGDMSAYSIRLTDSAGAVRCFTLYLSGRNGDPLLYTN